MFNLEPPEERSNRDIVRNELFLAGFSNEEVDAVSFYFGAANFIMKWGDAIEKGDVMYMGEYLFFIGLNRKFVMEVRNYFISDPTDFKSSQSHFVFVSSIARSKNIKLKRLLQGIDITYEIHKRQTGSKDDELSGD